MGLDFLQSERRGVLVFELEEHLQDEYFFGLFIRGIPYLEITI